ncbi:MAG: C1 family peptidase [Polyangiales bacterium]
MKRYARYWAGSLLLTASCVASCAPAPSSSGNNRKPWGEETAQGPRVGGRSVGPITVQGRTGTGYDVDGDGRADEIDLDGDGISDGEDVDGDGTISLWNQFQAGWVPDSDPTNDLPASDPDDFARLDPMMPVMNRAPNGTVNEPMTVSLASDGPSMATMATNAPNSNGDLLRPLNQGQQGSCNAFANAGLGAILRFNRERMSNPSADANALWPSPSYIYSRVLGTSACNQGTTIVSALNLFARLGAATLTEQPYRSGDMPMLCEPTMPDVAETPHEYRIGSWQRIGGTGTQRRARIREALAAGIPVPFGVNLPEGFMEFRETTAGTNVREPFRGTGMCTGSGHCGGHAMLITGYSDEKSAYRVLNSWGNDWGDGGYLWWDYASLEGAQNFDAYQVIPVLGAPTPLPATPPAITMTQPMGSQPVLRQVQYNFTSGPATRWTLFVRVAFNDPVTVRTLSATVDGNAQGFGVDSTLSYGDLAFLMPGDAMPTAGSMAELTVEGADRAGATFMQTLTVMVPAATTE